MDMKKWGGPERDFYGFSHSSVGITCLVHGQ